MSDYIKREDAINVIHGLTMYRGTIPFDSVIFNINKVSPADVRENVRGDWIYKKNSASCWCSICDFENKHYYKDELDFCPNCGADMRGDKP